MKRFIILFLLIFAVNAFAHGPFPKIKKLDTNFIYVSGDSVGIVLLTGDTLWFGSGIYYNSTHDSTLATQEWVTLQGYSSSTSDSVLYADSAYFADSALGAVRAETSDSTNKALRDASGNIITSTYLMTESDPNALLTAGTDNVKDTHIDFGTGAGQVSMTDMKGGNNKIFYSNGTGSVTEVTLGSSGTYLKSQGTGFIPTFDTPSGAGLSYWTESDVGNTSVFTATSPNTILGLGNNLNMRGNNIDNWWILSASNVYDAAIQAGNDFSLYLHIPQDSNWLIIQIGNFKWYFNKDSLYSEAGGYISIDTLTVDSGLYVGDDITVTGTVDGVDISTLSTTVGKVTDDTTKWKTVASLFDTSYKFLTVDSSQFDTITTDKVKITTTLILGSDSITDITGTGLSITGGVLNSSGSGYLSLSDTAATVTNGNAQIVTGNAIYDWVIGLGYLNTESDPVWVSDSGDYAMKTWVRTEVWDSLVEVWSALNAGSGLWDSTATFGIDRFALIGRENDTAIYITVDTAADTININFGQNESNEVHIVNVSQLEVDTLGVAGMTTTDSLTVYGRINFPANSLKDSMISNDITITEVDPVWTSDSGNYAMKTWVGGFIDTTQNDTIEHSHYAIESQHSDSLVGINGYAFFSGKTLIYKNDTSRIELNNYLNSPSMSFYSNDSLLGQILTGATGTSAYDEGAMVLSSTRNGSSGYLAINPDGSARSSILEVMEIQINGDPINDFTGDNLSVTSGVLNVAIPAQGDSIYWDAIADQVAADSSAWNANGETNTLANTGTYNGTSGFGLAGGKTGTALKVKGLIEGTNITIAGSGDSAYTITGSSGFPDSGSYIEIPKSVMNTRIILGNVSDTGVTDSIAATHGYVDSMTSNILNEDPQIRGYLEVVGPLEHWDWRYELDTTPIWGITASLRSDTGTHAQELIPVSDSSWSLNPSINYKNVYKYSQGHPSRIHIPGGFRVGSNIYTDLICVTPLGDSLSEAAVIVGSKDNCQTYEWIVDDTGASSNKKIRPFSEGSTETDGDIALMPDGRIASIARISGKLLVLSVSSDCIYWSGITNVGYGLCDTILYDSVTAAASANLADDSFIPYGLSPGDSCRIRPMFISPSLVCLGTNDYLIYALETGWNWAGQDIDFCFPNPDSATTLVMYRSDSIHTGWTLVDTTRGFGDYTAGKYGYNADSNYAAYFRHPHQSTYEPTNVDMWHAKFRHISRTHAVGMVYSSSGGGGTGDTTGQYLCESRDGGLHWSWLNDSNVVINHSNGVGFELLCGYRADWIWENTGNGLTMDVLTGGKASNGSNLWGVGHTVIYIGDSLFNYIPYVDTGSSIVDTFWQAIEGEPHYNSKTPGDSVWMSLRQRDDSGYSYLVKDSMVGASDVCDTIFLNYITPPNCYRIDSLVIGYKMTSTTAAVMKIDKIRVDSSASQWMPPILVARDSTTDVTATVANTWERRRWILSTGGSGGQLLQDGGKTILLRIVVQGDAGHYIEIGSAKLWCQIRQGMKVN